MDERDSQQQPKRRLFAFWARYRAKQDQKTIDVLSNDAGREDVRAAQAAHQSNQAKATGEAGRGLRG